MSNPETFACCTGLSQTMPPLGLVMQRQSAGVKAKQALHSQASVATLLGQQVASRNMQR